MSNTHARRNLLQRLRTHDGEALGRELQRWLATPPTHARLLLTTALCLAIVLALFLIRRPAALQRGMWGQVLIHGLPITLLVNLSAGAIYRRYLARRPPQRLRTLLAFVLVDATWRIALLLVLTAVSFIWWTQWRGAFAGDPYSALSAVPESFRYGIRFESLTGVYLYTVGLCAWPYFTAQALPLMAAKRGWPIVHSTLGALHPVGRLPVVSVSIHFALGAALVLTLTHTLLGVLT